MGPLANVTRHDRTRAHWRRLLVGAGIAAVAALAAALSGVILAADKGSTEGRALAAAFAECDVADLTFIGRVSHDAPGGEKTVWEQHTARLRNLGDEERVWVEVDTQRRLVVGASWSFRPLDVRSRPKPTSAAEAERVARQFLREKCAYYNANDTLQVRPATYDEEAPAFAVEFSGPGPAGNTHSVEARVDALRGKVQAYALRIVPPAPAATSPVRISEARARSLVLAKAKAMGISIRELTVPGRSTRSPFGPPGTPMHLIRVVGTQDLGDGSGRQIGYCEQWAVHATTGEVLAEPTNLPPGPPLPAKQ